MYIEHIKYGKQKLKHAWLMYENQQVYVNKSLN